MAGSEGQVTRKKDDDEGQARRPGLNGYRERKTAAIRLTHGGGRESTTRAMVRGVSQREASPLAESGKEDEGVADGARRIIQVIGAHSSRGAGAAKASGVAFGTSC